MKKRPFWFEIGSYRLHLPASADVIAKVYLPDDDAVAVGFTTWTVTLGRFRLFVNLSERPLGGLKYSIDSQTKSDVSVQDVSVNGIPGVTFGNYQEPRTWIDWWFRKGDMTLCLCLQSIVFPVTLPGGLEISEHEAVINSIQSRIPIDN